MYIKRPGWPSSAPEHVAPNIDLIEGNNEGRKLLTKKPSGFETVVQEDEGC
jgi:hypothetical protein